MNSLVIMCNTETQFRELCPEKERRNIAVALPVPAQTLTSLNIYFRLNSATQTGLRVVHLDDFEIDKEATVICRRCENNYEQQAHWVLAAQSACVVE